MGFRDELGAAQARADALQRRVAELEAANAALERGEEPVAPVPQTQLRRQFLVRLAAVMLGFAAALAGGGALALTMDMEEVGVIVLITAGMIAAGYFVLASLIEIVPPGFVLVLSGRRHRAPDGRDIGYRVIPAGRVLRVPMLEISDRLDVRPRPIDVNVRGAYSKGNVPLDIDATAVIHLARYQPQLDHAIERFLGRGPDEVDRVARETLEGHLRGAVATLTPDEIRHDAEKLAHYLVAEAEDDFARLGIVLDSLQVERVSGD